MKLAGPALAFTSFATFSQVELAAAWGAVGHEVVATIAQIHLHPSASAALQNILPETDGRLSSVATWADRIRMMPQWRFSAQLHYTSANEDHPPDACVFGEKGWKTDQDVLHAIGNYSQRLLDNPMDRVALSFLVHFVGDSHQPLHLTSRERGGNGDRALWEGRHINLHSLWDNYLIAKAIHEQANYTRPLPSVQIERHLRGTIYDPYIRLILWEGVRIWWRSQLEDWLACSFNGSILPHTDSQMILAGPPLTPAEAVDASLTIANSICPYTWAGQTHKVTCDMVFPKDYNTSAPAAELCTEEYYGPIRGNNVIERLLAQAGLRLAASLNAIFADPDEIRAEGYLSRAWLYEDL